jgi:hypothetical protein
VLCAAAPFRFGRATHGEPLLPHPRPLPLEWCLQGAVLVLPGAVRPRVFAGQAPAAFVVTAALQAPVEQQPARLQVGNGTDHLRVALGGHLHLQEVGGGSRTASMSMAEGWGRPCADRRQLAGRGLLQG